VNVKQINDYLLKIPITIKRQLRHNSNLNTGAALDSMIGIA